MDQAVARRQDTIPLRVSICDYYIEVLLLDFKMRVYCLDAHLVHPCVGYTS